MGNSQFVGTNFEDGLQAPHYFNGRLLSAEDLQADQRSVLQRESWLGRASGYGVIEGLMVTQANTTNVQTNATSVQITAGIGLNRQGQIVRLPKDFILTLTPPAAHAQQTSVTDTGRFTSCDVQSTVRGDATPAGIYLLTALPASHFEGLAPMKQMAGSVTMSTSSDSAGCGSKWEVEGIRFKIIPLTGFDAKAEGVTDNNRRNLLAHWCFGSVVLPDEALDPFHFPADFGGLDLADLTPCDLPLAVFYWTGSKLTFVDAWSARRRLIRPDALATAQPHWKGILSDQRVAVVQARFLQFQDHVQQLVDEKKANVVVVKDYFRFLPPVGFLPVTLDSLRHLVGLPPSSATGAEAQQVPPATSNPFTSELRTLLQTRQAAEGSAGSVVNRGVDGFDYARFFDSKQFFWIRSVIPSPTIVLAVDVKGADTGPSARIIVQKRTDSPTDNQLWYFADGYVISKLNGYALTGTGSEPGTPLTAETKKHPQTPNQQWKLVPDTPELNYLVSEFKGYVAESYVVDPNKGDSVIWNRNYGDERSGILWFLDPYVTNPDTPYVTNPATNLVAPFVFHQALVESAVVASLLQRSWYDDAIDIDQLYNSPKAPLLNMYFVRENLASPSSPPYVVVVRARRPVVWSIPPQ
jgi:hypothetical protein